MLRNGDNGHFAIHGIWGQENCPILTREEGSHRTSNLKRGILLGERQKSFHTVPRRFYAMPSTCVGTCGSAGREIARGQEMLSMPSARHAFMSLT